MLGGKRSGKGKVGKMAKKGPKKSNKQKSNKQKSNKKKSNKQKSNKQKMSDNKNMGNNKPVTVTCLKCKSKIQLTDYTSKKTKNGAMLVQGICNKGCMTNDNKPVKVAGFTKFYPENAK